MCPLTEVCGKEHGSIPYMTSHTALHAFLQRLNATQISL